MAATSRFGDDVEGRGPWTFRMADNQQAFHVFELCFGHSELGWVQVPRPGLDRRASGGNVVVYTILGSC